MNEENMSASRTSSLAYSSTLFSAPHSSLNKKNLCPLVLPDDMQNVVCDFVSTHAAAHLQRVSKSFMAMITNHHDAYRLAARGRVLRESILLDLKKRKQRLPKWLYGMSCDALELVGKGIIDLKRLVTDDMRSYPYVCYEAIFNKKILTALQLQLVTMDQLISQLTIIGNFDEMDVVDTLFLGEEKSERLVCQISLVVDYREQLTANGVVIDKVFVEAFLASQISDEITGKKYFEQLLADPLLRARAPLVSF
jgi:hypothetical protein